MLRLIAYSFGGIIRMEWGMAPGYQMGIIIPPPLDCMSSQPPYQPDKTVLVADLRRPPIHVVTECHTGPEWQIITTQFLALDWLDKHSHAFVIILQSFTSAIEQCV